MVKSLTFVTLSVALTLAAQERQSPVTHVPATQSKPPATQSEANRQKKEDAAARRRQFLEELARLAVQEAARAGEPKPKPQPTQPSQATTGGSRASTVVPQYVFPPRANPAEDERWQNAWEEREGLFESIDRDNPSDAEKLWAIKTLWNEAAFLQRHFATTSEGLGEGYGAYYIDLTLFVTRLKDPRSIESLAVAMDVAPAISTTLAELGEPAVDPVIGLLANPCLRESAAYTLGKFLQGQREGRSRLAPATVTKIRQALVRAAVSDVPSLRRNAVRALRKVELTREEQAVMSRAGGAQ
ncbi:MAG TPA: hypothetical protein VGF69_06995 [Thermoanaerobaculia bacterium]|jgi:hypothetical protein